MCSGVVGLFEVLKETGSGLALEWTDDPGPVLKCAFRDHGENSPPRFGVVGVGLGESFVFNDPGGRGLVSFKLLLPSSSIFVGGIDTLRVRLLGSMRDFVFRWSRFFMNDFRLELLGGGVSVSDKGGIPIPACQKSNEKRALLLFAGAELGCAKPKTLGSDFGVMASNGSNPTSDCTCLWYFPSVGVFTSACACTSGMGLFCVSVLLLLNNSATKSSCAAVVVAVKMQEGWASSPSVFDEGSRVCIVCTGSIMMAKPVLCFV